MKKSNLFKALAASAILSTAMAANAKTETYSVGFVTIQDLNISQSQGMSFAQNVIGKTGTTCTLHFAVTGTGTGLAVAADVDDGLAGNGCLTVGGGASPTAVSNLAGIYHITGAAGQAVNVTVASITSDAFNFTPSGQSVTQGDALATAANQTSVFADSPAADSIGAGANNGVSLVVGGTLTIGAADLTANTPYSGSFAITAIY
jgi:hypothetical protein